RRAARAPPRRSIGLTMSLPEWTNPPGVYAPVPHYSQVARAGNTLYISGQLAIDERGELVGLGDARAQARQAWKNLVGVVAASAAPPPPPAQNKHHTPPHPQ